MSDAPFGLCSRCGENPRPSRARYWCRECGAAYQRERNARLRTETEEAPELLRQALVIVDCLDVNLHDDKGPDEHDLDMARLAIATLVRNLQRMYDRASDAAKEAREAPAPKGRAPKGTGGMVPNIPSLADVQKALGLCAPYLHDRVKYDANWNNYIFALRNLYAYYPDEYKALGLETSVKAEVEQ
jgi:hypothetical protein